MAKLKERETTVTITAYDAEGEVLDKLGPITSRYTPSLRLLEFQMDVEAKYPSVRRIEMAIAY